MEGACLSSSPWSLPCEKAWTTAEDFVVFVVEDFEEVFPHYRDTLFQKAGDEKENKPNSLKDLLLLSDSQSYDGFIKFRRW